jgi:hypothetical protein
MRNRFATPGMGAHVNTYRAIVGTNSTLHTARRVRDHLSRGEHRIFACITFEKSKNAHTIPVACTAEKLRPDFIIDR